MHAHVQARTLCAIGTSANCDKSKLKPFLVPKPLKTIHNLRVLVFPLLDSVIRFHKN